MAAYYNEIDPYAAQWLRNLISAGHIAPGDVDERSIVDVRPDDLRGYGQRHFFAGIGGWPLALRLAGWPDDRPVWTGSCPCQPFSAAGKGKAADDERHLWPRWFPLIAELRPPVVFGEQVEAAIGWGWLDAVFAHLETEGYACGAAVLPACSVGAPHIRARTWFVADAAGGSVPESRRRSIRREGNGVLGTLADALHAGRPEGRAIAGGGSASCGGGASELADAVGRRADRRGYESQSRAQDASQGALGAQEWERIRLLTRGDLRMGNAAGCGRSRVRHQPAHALTRQAGTWDCAWLPCTDGKARPVEPGTFPLAHAIPGRV